MESLDETNEITMDSFRKAAYLLKYENINKFIDFMISIKSTFFQESDALSLWYVALRQIRKVLSSHTRWIPKISEWDKLASFVLEYILFPSHHKSAMPRIIRDLFFKDLNSVEPFDGSQGLVRVLWKVYFEILEELTQSSIGRSLQYKFHESHFITADIKVEFPHRWNLLHFYLLSNSCPLGCHDMIRTLIQLGIHPQAQTPKEGFTALHVASMTAKFNAVSFLLSRYPSLLTDVDHIGRTPLDLLSERIPLMSFSTNSKNSTSMTWIASHTSSSTMTSLSNINSETINSIIYELSNPNNHFALLWKCAPVANRAKPLLTSPSQSPSKRRNRRANFDDDDDDDNLTGASYWQHNHVENKEILDKKNGITGDMSQDSLWVWKKPPLYNLIVHSNEVIGSSVLNLVALTDRSLWMPHILMEIGYKLVSKDRSSSLEIFLKLFWKKFQESSFLERLFPSSLESISTMQKGEWVAGWFQSLLILACHCRSSHSWEKLLSYVPEFFPRNSENETFSWWTSSVELPVFHAAIVADVALRSSLSSSSSIVQLPKFTDSLISTINQHSENPLFQSNLYQFLYFPASFSWKCLNGIWKEYLDFFFKEYPNVQYSEISSQLSPFSWIGVLGDLDLWTYISTLQLSNGRLTSGNSSNSASIAIAIDGVGSSAAASIRQSSQSYIECKKYVLQSLRCKSSHLSHSCLNASCINASSSTSSNNDQDIRWNVFDICILFCRSTFLKKLRAILGSKIFGEYLATSAALDCFWELIKLTSHPRNSDTVISLPDYLFAQFGSSFSTSGKVVDDIHAASSSMPESYLRTAVPNLKETFDLIVESLSALGSMITDRRKDVDKNIKGTVSSDIESRNLDDHSKDNQSSSEFLSSMDEGGDQEDYEEQDQDQDQNEDQDTWSASNPSLRYHRKKFSKYWLETIENHLEEPSFLELLDGMRDYDFTRILSDELGEQSSSSPLNSDTSQGDVAVQNRNHRIEETCLQTFQFYQNQHDYDATYGLPSVVSLSKGDKPSSNAEAELDGKSQQNKVSSKKKKEEFHLHVRFQEHGKIMKFLVASILHAQKKIFNVFQQCEQPSVVEDNISDALQLDGTKEFTSWFMQENLINSWLDQCCSPLPQSSMTSSSSSTSVPPHSPSNPLIQTLRQEWTMHPGYLVVMEALTNRRNSKQDLSKSSSAEINQEFKDEESIEEGPVIEETNVGMQLRMWFSYKELLERCLKKALKLEKWIQSSSFAAHLRLLTKKFECNSSWNSFFELLLLLVFPAKQGNNSSTAPNKSRNGNWTDFVRYSTTFMRASGAHDQHKNVLVHAMIDLLQQTSQELVGIPGTSETCHRIFQEDFLAQAKTILQQLADDRNFWETFSASHSSTASNESLHQTHRIFNSDQEKLGTFHDHRHWISEKEIEKCRIYEHWMADPLQSDGERIENDTLMHSHVQDPLEDLLDPLSDGLDTLDRDILWNYNKHPRISLEMNSSQLSALSRAQNIQLATFQAFSTHSVQQDVRLKKILLGIFEFLRCILQISVLKGVGDMNLMFAVNIPLSNSIISSNSVKNLSKTELSDVSTNIQTVRMELSLSKCFFLYQEFQHLNEGLGLLRSRSWECSEVSQTWICDPAIRSTLLYCNRSISDSLSRNTCCNQRSKSLHGDVNLATASVTAGSDEIKENTASIGFDIFATPLFHLLSPRFCILESQSLTNLMQKVAQFAQTLNLEGILSSNHEICRFFSFCQDKLISSHGLLHQNFNSTYNNNRQENSPFHLLDAMVLDLLGRASNFPFDILQPFYLVPQVRRMSTLSSFEGNKSNSIGEISLSHSITGSTSNPLFLWMTGRNCWESAKVFLDLSWEKDRSLQANGKYLSFQVFSGQEMIEIEDEELIHREQGKGLNEEVSEMNEDIAEEDLGNLHISGRKWHELSYSHEKSMTSKTMERFHAPFHASCEEIASYYMHNSLPGSTFQIVSEKQLDSCEASVSTIEHRFEAEVVFSWDRIFPDALPNSMKQLASKHVTSLTVFHIALFHNQEAIFAKFLDIARLCSWESMVGQLLNLPLNIFQAMNLRSMNAFSPVLIWKWWCLFLSPFFRPPSWLSGLRSCEEENVFTQFSFEKCSSNSGLIQLFDKEDDFSMARELFSSEPINSILSTDKKFHPQERLHEAHEFQSNLENVRLNSRLQRKKEKIPRWIVMMVTRLQQYYQSHEFQSHFHYNVSDFHFFTLCPLTLSTPRKVEQQKFVSTVTAMENKEEKYGNYMPTSFVIDDHVGIDSPLESNSVEHGKFPSFSGLIGLLRCYSWAVDAFPDVDHFVSFFHDNSSNFPFMIALFHAFQTLRTSKLKKSETTVLKNNEVVDNQVTLAHIRLKLHKKWKYKLDYLKTILFGAFHESISYGNEMIMYLAPSCSDAGSSSAFKGAGIPCENNFQRLHYCMKRCEKVYQMIIDSSPTVQSSSTVLPSFNLHFQTFLTLCNVNPMKNFDTLMKAKQVLSLLHISFSQLRGLQSFSTSSADSTSKTPENSSSFLNLESFRTRISFHIYVQLQSLLNCWYFTHCSTASSTLLFSSNGVASRGPCHSLRLLPFLADSLEIQKDPHYLMNLQARRHLIEASLWIRKQLVVSVSFLALCRPKDSFEREKRQSNEADVEEPINRNGPLKEQVEFKDNYLDYQRRSWAEIISMEVSHLENSGTILSESWASSDFSGLKIKEVLEGLQQAYLILELARQIVVSRTLAIVTHCGFNSSNNYLSRLSIGGASNRFHGSSGTRSIPGRNKDIFASNIVANSVTDVEKASDKVKIATSNLKDLSRIQRTLKNLSLTPFAFKNAKISSDETSALPLNHISAVPSHPLLLAKEMLDIYNQKLDEWKHEELVGVDKKEYHRFHFFPNSIIGISSYVRSFQSLRYEEALFFFENDVKEHPRITSFRKSFAVFMSDFCYFMGHFDLTEFLLRAIRYQFREKSLLSSDSDSIITDTSSLFTNKDEASRFLLEKKGIRLDFKQGVSKVIEVLLGSTVEQLFDGFDYLFHWSSEDFALISKKLRHFLESFLILKQEKQQFVSKSGLPFSILVNLLYEFCDKTILLLHHRFPWVCPTLPFFRGWIAGSNFPVSQEMKSMRKLRLERNRVLIRYSNGSFIGLFQTLQVFKRILWSIWNLPNLMQPTSLQAIRYTCQKFFNGSSFCLDSKVLETFRKDARFEHLAVSVVFFCLSLGWHDYFLEESTFFGQLFVSILPQLKSINLLWMLFMITSPVLHDSDRNLWHGNSLKKPLFPCPELGTTIVWLINQGFTLEGPSGSQSSCLHWALFKNLEDTSLRLLDRMEYCRERSKLPLSPSRNSTKGVSVNQKDCNTVNVDVKSLILALTSPSFSSYFFSKILRHFAILNENWAFKQPSLSIFMSMVEDWKILCRNDSDFSSFSLCHPSWKYRIPLICQSLCQFRITSSRITIPGDTLCYVQRMKYCEKESPPFLMWKEILQACETWSCFSSPDNEESSSIPSFNALFRYLYTNTSLTPFHQHTKQIEEVIGISFRSKRLCWWEASLFQVHPEQSREVFHFILQFLKDQIEFYQNSSSKANVELSLLPDISDHSNDQPTPPPPPPPPPGPSKDVSWLSTLSLPAVRFLLHQLKPLVSLKLSSNLPLPSSKVGKLFQFFALQDFEELFLLTFSWIELCQKLVARLKYLEDHLQSGRPLRISDSLSLDLLLESPENDSQQYSTVSLLPPTESSYQGPEKSSSMLSDTSMMQPSLLLSLTSFRLKTSWWEILEQSLRYLRRSLKKSMMTDTSTEKSSLDKKFKQQAKNSSKKNGRKDAKEKQNADNQEDGDDLDDSDDEYDDDNRDEEDPEEQIQEEIQSLLMDMMTRFNSRRLRYFLVKWMKQLENISFPKISSSSSSSSSSASASSTSSMVSNMDPEGCLKFSYPFYFPVIATLSNRTDIERLHTLRRLQWWSNWILAYCQGGMNEKDMLFLLTRSFPLIPSVKAKGVSQVAAGSNFGKNPSSYIDDELKDEVQRLIDSLVSRACSQGHASILGFLVDQKLVDLSEEDWIQSMGLGQVAISRYMSSLPVMEPYVKAKRLLVWAFRKYLLRRSEKSRKKFSHS